MQTRRFTGRSVELWNLHAKLTANRISIITGNYGQAVTQVRGLAGNGKSLLAREYSIRFGPAYPGGIYWLDAHGDRDQTLPGPDLSDAHRNDQIRHFAISIGLSVENRKPSEIEADFWRELQCRKEECLWIVDDIPPGLDSSILERTWFARCSNASTLITTQSREYGGTGELLDLGVLTSDEAAQLLRLHRVPTAQQEPAFREIIEMLGGHPLAVDVAGSYLAKGLQTFEEYLVDLQNSSQAAVEFGALLRESLPTQHERSITKTLLKSVSQLGEEGLDFLRLAAVVAVAPIRASFVAEVLQESNLYASGQMPALQGIDQAFSLSLCEKDGDDSYRVHTLVSGAVRMQFVDDERRLVLRNAAIKALTRRLSAVVDHRQHGSLANDLAHARHFANDVISQPGESALATRVAQYDFLRGDYASARKLQQKLVDAADRLFRPEHPEFLTLVNNLSETMHAQGDFAATVRLQEETLSKSEVALGREHPITLVVAHNLAATLFELGDWPRAQALQTRVVSASRRQMGNEHPRTLSAINSLGWTLYVRGDLPAAGDLLNEVVDARRRVLGPDHAETLSAMGNLARIKYSEGDLAAAGRLQEEILAGTRSLMGDRHPRMVIAMDNLAQTYRAEKRFTAAQQLQESALELAEQVLPKDHPDTLKVMHNLGRTLKSQGHLKAARELQERVLAAWLRMIGPEHPNTLVAMNNLAATLYAQGNRAEALTMQEEALAGYRKVYGEEHADTQGAMENLAAMRAQRRLAL